MGTGSIKPFVFCFKILYVCFFNLNLTCAIRTELELLKSLMKDS